MRLVIGTDGIEVADPADFGSFTVETVLPTARLEATIAHLGVGKLDPDEEHVWIGPSAVEAAVVVAARSAAWDEGFAAMCAYAGSHGWLDDEGRVRAHLVARQDSPPVTRETRPVRRGPR